MVKIKVCVLFACMASLSGILHAQAEVLPEAEQMALEISEVMLPPKKLSRRISEHLNAIRKIYPMVSSVHHSPKFVPGELIVLSFEGEEFVRKVNNSRYGPLKSAVKLGTSDETYQLVFEKPYHPARLAERMRQELGVSEVEGNLLFGDGDDVTYHDTAPTYVTYTFKKGWGDCQSASGCSYKHYWEFTVAPSQETLTVKLEKEYGSSLSLGQPVA